MRTFRETMMMGLATACATAVLASAAPARAGSLHGFCTNGDPICSDNGSITPTSTNPPAFGFTKVPDSGTANPFLLEVLIPDNVAGAGSESITISGTNTGNASVTGTLFSTTPWTSGQLDAYLGFSAAPTNPIGAWLPLTQTYQAAADGYDVYSFNFGGVTFSGAADPTFTTSFVFPTGTIITAFSDEPVCTTKRGGTTCKDDWTATANSAALIVTDGSPPPSVPEPVSMAMLSLGLASLALVRRRA